MAKKLKLKDQIAMINSNINSIGCIMEKELINDKELEREKLELEREKLNWEMKSKDRVDISLNEYTHLQEDYKYYKQRCRNLEELLKKIKIEPFIDKIIKPSLQISTMRDPARLTTRVNIQFDCDGLDIEQDIDPFGAFRKY